MSINSPAGSSGVLAQQPFAQQSQATRNNPSSQAGDTFDMLPPVQPPGSVPPGAAAAGSGTTTRIVTPPGGQADSASQQLTNLRSYLLGLQPDTISGTADSAATPGTPSTVPSVTNAAVARQYMAGSGSSSSIVSGTMIC
jgi:hypothetical protein